METKWQLVAINCRLQKPPLYCLPTSSKPRRRASGGGSEAWQWGIFNGWRNGGGHEVNREGMGGDSTRAYCV
ncbi:MAG: hypothetical protein LBJ94_00650 [Puniceicoccales bacterium]|nr:hypothetical protein [Puniceicoccales bacterium]